MEIGEIFRESVYRKFLGDLAVLRGIVGAFEVFDGRASNVRWFPSGCRELKVVLALSGGLSRRFLSAVSKPEVEALSGSASLKSLMISGRRVPPVQTKSAWKPSPKDSVTTEPPTMARRSRTKTFCLFSQDRLRQPIHCAPRR